uniref:Fibroblast growth factor receptor 1Alike [Xiphosphorus maculatus] n=1 Tax=Lepeophtheirus salmonis TaxID=72036 RepID=A0A0K2TQJ0_LEPSM
MNILGLLLFLLFYSKSGTAKTVCSKPSGTLSLLPDIAFISSTTNQKSKKRTLFIGNTQEFSLQCNNSIKSFTLSEMSYSNGLNYEKIIMPCGEECSSEIIVLGSNAIDMVNCTANNSKISCETEGVLDVVSPERNPSTSIKYSFYDTTISSWIKCAKYDDNNKEINDLNQLDMFDNTVIICPFNESSSQSSDNVLVRLEKDEALAKVALAVRTFNFRTKRSPNYTYFTVKVAVAVSDPIKEQENVKGGINSTIMIVSGALVGLFMILLLSLVFIYQMKKRDLLSKVSSAHHSNEKISDVFYVSSSKSSESDTISTIIPQDYDSVFVVDDAGKRRLLKRQLSGDPNKLNPEMYLNHQASALSYDQGYEIPRCDFTIGKMLGSGNFGSVYEGEVCGLFGPTSKTKAAVKTVNDSTDISRLTALLCEIKILGKIEPHLSLLSMLGACAAGLENDGELYLLLEHCPHGNLKSYLIEKRSQFKNGYNNQLLTEWAYGIAQGLKYLNSYRIMHGDLAARNILLGHDLVAKVSDFGLSKSMYDKYRYRKTNRQYVPWKWMAIEYLQDGCFHLNSDAWSYGVVLWEIFSLGEEPYFGERMDVVVNKLRQGHRLSSPDLLDDIDNGDIIYNDVMYPSWKEDPKERITFENIIEIFENVILNEDTIQIYSDRYKRHKEIHNAKKTKAENIRNPKMPVVVEESTPDTNGYITVQMACEHV